ncbi:MAG: hypothetical protein M9924_01995 [Rhizobiaceae bacterium]|nr:hypothetical protein [Rhizobiaceae bacterium]
MARIIGSILSHIPEILFVAAILLAFLSRKNHSLDRRFLDWMLLLGIGVSYVWSGVFHVFFPNVAASSIGWANSPFQFEIGVADIAIGIAAILSFWRGLEFKSAVVIYIALFCFGVAVGHFYQAAATQDYAANNFGVLLVITLIQMVALPYWLWKSQREARATS